MDGVVRLLLESDLVRTEFGGYKPFDAGSDCGVNNWQLLSGMSWRHRTDNRITALKSSIYIFVRVSIGDLLDVNA